MARFPWVSDPDPILVLPDGRVVMNVFYSGRTRLVAVERGKPPVAMVTTTEETSTPAAMTGQGEIAFLIGPEPRGTIGFADIETAGVMRRIDPGNGEIVWLAGTSIAPLFTSPPAARSGRFPQLVVTD